MIRGFSLLCKINFNHYSTLALFHNCMALIKVQSLPCPECGTKRPDWARHGTYARDLIGFEKGIVVYNIVNAIRFKCSSCGSTHAFPPLNSSSLLNHIASSSSWPL